MSWLLSPKLRLSSVFCVAADADATTAGGRVSPATWSAASVESRCWMVPSSEAKRSNGSVSVSGKWIAQDSPPQSCICS